MTRTSSRRIYCDDDVVCVVAAVEVHDVDRDLIQAAIHELLHILRGEGLLGAVCGDSHALAQAAA